MKRQLNVQQQNAELKASVLAASGKYIANDPYTRWVSEVLLQSSLNPAEGILVEFTTVPDQCGECAYATWLTLDGRFYKIEAMLEYETHTLQSIESFEHVSSEVIVAEHLRGTGRSLGSIALEVLRERAPGANHSLEGRRP